MIKLSILLTAVLSVFTFSALAANMCEDYKLGEYRKTQWSDSISDGLRGELVNQLAKKDDLFEKISPELEFGLTDGVDLKVRFSRSVKDHLPLPFTGEITEYDFFKYKVNNKINLEFSGKLSGPFLFSEGSMGLDLIHSTDLKPGVEQTPCDVFDKVIDTSTEEGADFVKSVCQYRNKGYFTRYYEGIINFANKGLSWFLNLFADSEKNKLHANKALAPMKLHSKLGIPMDHKVFFEGNSDLAIGDIVEHTSFFNLKPVGIKFDLFSFIEPTYARFKKYFRSLSFKKEYGNKVIVEIQDAVLSGDSIEVFKLRPKIFGVIKLNLGRWNDDEFKEQNLTQRFVVDLNKNDGVEFFKKVLKSAYEQPIGLSKDDILIDFSDYADAVEAYRPLYQNGLNEDNRIFLKLPGVFKYSNRSLHKVSTITDGDESYTKGESFHSESYRQKFNINLGIFKFPKQDKKYECQAVYEVNETRDVKNPRSLNFECNYNNRYADNKVLNQVYQSLMMTVNGDIPENDLNEIYNLSLNGKDKISMFTNLSFGEDQIQKIAQVTEDEAYHEIAKLLFGEGAANIFGTKYTRRWKQLARNINSYKGIEGAKLQRCSFLLEKLEITNGRDTRYDEFAGIVGRKKGIKSIDSYRCIRYFNHAKRIVLKLKAFQEETKSEDRADKILGTFTDLEYSGLIQNLFLRLAGGTGFRDVRYTYIITSPKLERNIVRTTGPKYTANLPVRESHIRELINSDFQPRIKKLNFNINSCLHNTMKVKLDLFYPVSEGADLALKFIIREFSYVKDHSVAEVIVPLSEMNFDGISYTGTFAFPEGYLFDEAYNYYTTLVNSKGEPLSKETKSYVSKIINLEVMKDEND